MPSHPGDLLRPIWEPAQTAVLDEALARAGAGTPILLVVEGEAGFGKTSLLDELERRADGFQVAAAEGAGREAVPFGVLAEWGADAALEASSAFVAAQRLREHLDRRATRAPVLLRLDDLHRADPGSVDAVGWLLRRAAGDRLLVAVAARRSETPVADWWRRGIGRDTTRSLSLTGLATPAVATLVHRRHPWADATLVTRLAEHTGGNPLYLATILDEHDPTELAGMRVLPAPAQFADAVAVRLDRLPRSAVTTARAAAVLGSGRHTVPDLAAVAQVEDPAGDVQALVDAGLLHLSTAAADVRVRSAHALVGAAIYQRTPLPDRVALHERAAAAATDPSSALEHRVSAAVRADAQLADAAAAHAEHLHRLRRHRRAAQFLRYAAGVTPEPVARRHRLLDAALEDAFAHDFRAAHAALGDGPPPDASDDPYRVAVHGAVLSLEGRRTEAVALLEPVATGAAPLPPRTAFRMHALLAWAMLGIGHSAERMAEAVGQARALAGDDPAVASHLLFAEGNLHRRTRGIAPVLAGLEGVLPARAAGTPPGDDYLLSWRGMLRLDAGLFAEAAEDLAETQRRILAGLTEIADGAFHALLGFAQWFDGRCDLARISIGIALDRAEAAWAADPAGGVVFPFAHLVAPLGAVIGGDPARAERFLDRVEAELEVRPWPEAVAALLICRVVRAHARGSPAERAGLLADMRRRWPGHDSHSAGAMWLAHAALAGVWAGELDAVVDWTDRLAHAVPGPSWAPWVAAWLRGLVAEARGDRTTALDHLDAAVRAFVGVPLYRAHALVDHARLLRAAGRGAAARDALAGAVRLYRDLGATSYVHRVETLSGTARLRVSHDPLATLTERENDVLTLVVTGLSYTQIAHDLYITRSTVNYHLSNIYAKAGVSSRHELTELARRGDRRVAAPGRAP